LNERTKALAAGLDNIEFRLADMTALKNPDGSFDAVVSVFSIFFVPDMEGLVRELWRMVRPGGKLAVTTWGPRIFEPAYSRWLIAVGKERPDLVTAFNPMGSDYGCHLGQEITPRRRRRGR
jgi:ubiquinone/menaquinone biosynthesis C-methylase UbiE